MDSKELFNAMENNQIKFSEVKNKQNDFLNKLSNIKNGKKKKKILNKKKWLIILKNLTILEKKLIIFLEAILKCYLMLITMLKKETKGKGLKILTPKQMLQRLPIALAQVKAGNNSEGLLNEIRKIVYSLYQSNQINKKVCNSIIKSIQWNCAQIHIKMDTIFMDLENSETSKPDVLILKLTSKLDLRIDEKVIALPNLST